MNNVVTQYTCITHTIWHLQCITLHFMVPSWHNKLYSRSIGTGCVDWQILFSRKCTLTIYLSMYRTLTSWRKHRHGSIDILESTGHDKTSWDYRMRSKVTIKFIALVEILSLLIRVQQKTNKNSTYFYKARNNKSKAILNL